MNTINIPTPSESELKTYINSWNSLENYVLQEKSLDKLFFNLIPKNKDIQDILIKASALNDFYSTNIFSIFPVAKHILELNIDNRILKGDVLLVQDIANIEISGKHKYFYSFASKYCSHHNPNDFPIYDRNVENVLMYFSKRDGFSKIKKKDLKDYNYFKNTIIKFSEYYKLHNYHFKDLDRYLWQLGKKYFPKLY